jgi:hypothetical protein
MLLYANIKGTSLTGCGTSDYLQENIASVKNQLPMVSYIGVSKSSQTTSTDCKPMALHECVRYACEQGTMTLSVPSGVAV